MIKSERMIEMNQETTIGISLHVDHEIIDLQIPRQVTIARLKERLIELLSKYQLLLPKFFDLVVLNKSIQLNEDLSLFDYPISEGDQLFVKPYLFNGDN